MKNITRREFVQATAAGAAVLAIPASAGARAQDADPIRFGLVGCGGRGKGAAENCLQSAANVQMVAMADLFQDRLDGARDYFGKRKLKGFKVEDDRCYVGWDAYKQLLESDLDLVLFATPPGFRPLHFEAAIHAGKHVFMEKPVAVDPTGVRRVIKAGKEAKEKGLAVVAGTQYRHQESFLETFSRVHDGAIGEILSGRIYYNASELWHNGRKPEWTDMEWQVRNWLYFCWLSGDHIAEQHIHTIDVMNWGLGVHPVRAVGLGGRQIRTAEKYGNIYDHFAIDYEFPGGVHVMSLNRQMDRTAGHVGAYFTGTAGKAVLYQGRITGAKPWSYSGGKNISHAYVQEHADLIASIRAGKPLNESKQVAESTLTAIMGREAAYTGKMVKWDEILNSDLDLSPPEYAFGAAPSRGVPMPGKKRPS